MLSEFLWVEDVMYIDLGGEEYLEGGADFFDNWEGPFPALVMLLA